MEWWAWVLVAVIAWIGLSLVSGWLASRWFRWLNSSD
jgi:hypothetical protein